MPYKIDMSNQNRGSGLLIIESQHGVAQPTEISKYIISIDHISDIDVSKTINKVCKLTISYGTGNRLECELVKSDEKALINFLRKTQPNPNTKSVTGSILAAAGLV